MRGDLIEDERIRDNPPGDVDGVGGLLAGPQAHLPSGVTGASSGLSSPSGRASWVCLQRAALPTPGTTSPKMQTCSPTPEQRTRGYTCTPPAALCLLPTVPSLLGRSRVPARSSSGPWTRGREHMAAGGGAPPVWSTGYWGGRLFDRRWEPRPNSPTPPGTVTSPTRKRHPRGHTRRDTGSGRPSPSPPQRPARRPL